MAAKTTGPGQNPTRDRVLRCLFEASPMSSRELMRLTGLSGSQVYACLDRCWRAGLVLRTAESFYERERVFRGRLGSSAHIRPYHRYLLRSVGRAPACCDILGVSISVQQISEYGLDSAEDGETRGCSIHPLQT